MKRFKINQDLSVFYKGEEFIVENNAGVAYTNYNIDDIQNDVEGTDGKSEFLEERKLVEKVVSEDLGYESNIDDMGSQGAELAIKFGW